MTVQNTHDGGLELEPTPPLQYAVGLFGKISTDLGDSPRDMREHSKLSNGLSVSTHTEPCFGSVHRVSVRVVSTEKVSEKEPYRTYKAPLPTRGVWWTRVSCFTGLPLNQFRFNSRKKLLCLLYFFPGHPSKPERLAYFLYSRLLTPLLCFSNHTVLRTLLISVSSSFSPGDSFLLPETVLLRTLVSLSPPPPFQPLRSSRRPGTSHKRGRDSQQWPPDIRHTTSSGRIGRACLFFLTRENRLPQSEVDGWSVPTYSWTRTGDWTHKSRLSRNLSHCRDSQDSLLHLSSTNTGMTKQEILRICHERPCQMLPSLPP